MSVGYRDEGDTQLPGSDRDLASVADAAATRVASSTTELATQGWVPCGGG